MPPALLAGFVLEWSSYSTMGVAGAAIAGMLIYQEPATALRLACIALILAGVAGLKLVA